MHFQMFTVLFGIFEDVNISAKILVLCNPLDSGHVGKKLIMRKPSLRTAGQNSTCVIKHVDRIALIVNRFCKTSNQILWVDQNHPPHHFTISTFHAHRQGQDGNVFQAGIASTQIKQIAHRLPTTCCQIIAHISLQAQLLPTDRLVDHPIF